jgi:hypothetical protein
MLHVEIARSIAKLSNCFSALKQSLSVRAATDIATLPELDWQWFTELCISKEWALLPHYFYAIASSRMIARNSGLRIIASPIFRPLYRLR